MKEISVRLPIGWKIVLLQLQFNPSNCVFRKS
jgi:hypothetical protein